MTKLLSLLAALAFTVPALLAAPPAGAIEVQQVKSPGGITAWLVQDKLNPILSLRFAFRGGAALDPEGKEGLARMAAALLDEGAGDMDARAFRAALEDRSISLGFDSSFDEFGGSLQMLTEHRDTAAGLLALALTRPRFDADALARVRSQILARLRRDAESPDTVAQVRLFTEIFPGHAYGRRSRGTLESVPRIGPEDLRRFVGARFARDVLVVGVAGDITAAELGRLLDRAFGALPSSSAPAQIPEVAPKIDSRALVSRLKVPQSAIAFAAPGVKRDDPDYYAAYVLNYILGGGGFTSRLHEEVREKRGLAYSAGTSLHPLRRSALILGGAGTANARVKETIDVVRAEWRRMAEGGVSAEEIENAKTYLTGSFPLRFTTLGGIAGMLLGMQIENLGPDYIDRYNGLINAVSAESVARVARRLLDPARLLVVVAGEPEGLAPTE
ncbi:MAG: zinc protease [Rhodospirillales bacterium RIFCSPLOWO2_12_FULL_67_15]|nr:MAG: zinc protease [Rhodospirillales bacterium RIFCSPLOWO2_12_FULL_67_15]